MNIKEGNLIAGELKLYFFNLSRAETLPFNLKFKY